MKKIIALLLALTLVLSVAVMAGCAKKDKKGSGGDTSATTGAVVPEGADPIATTAEGKATGYTKLEKDEKGRVTRDYTYDSLGELQGSIGYEYDDHDFVIKEIRYNTEGAITSQVVLERNENGMETKRTEMDAQGKVTSVVVTEYDENGNTTRTNYDANGNVIQ